MAVYGCVWLCMAVYVWLYMYAGRAKASALYIPIHLRGSKDQGQNDLWKVNNFPGVVNSWTFVVRSLDT